MPKKNSMIIDHPYWDRIKAKKGTKVPGSNSLYIEEFILPNEKYFEMMEKLTGSHNAKDTTTD